ncbi:MAG TPA: hypothetical protein VLC08_02855 [Chitinolyticbacter sp.]|nr:hypothetical protein [Chitinolyticbacter sp.]
MQGPRANLVLRMVEIDSVSGAGLRPRQGPNALAAGDCCGSDLPVALVQALADL